MCVYCNSNCTHLFFVHPRVIIAFCIFIKQDSACSTFGVEVCPNAGGMCGLEGFFCLWFVWLGFGHFLVGRWGFLLLCCHVSGHLYLSVDLPSVTKTFFLRQFEYLN